MSRDDTTPNPSPVGHSEPLIEDEESIEQLEEQVEVAFTVASEHLDDAAKETLESGPVVLPRSMNAKDLHGLIQEILQPDASNDSQDDDDKMEGEASKSNLPKFEFFVQVPIVAAPKVQDDDSDEEQEETDRNLNSEFGDQAFEEVYLRTQIGRFMERFNLSGETVLQLRIVDAKPPPQTTELNEHRAQITAMAEIDGTGVIAAYSDGNVKVFDYDGTELARARISKLSLTHLCLTSLGSDEDYIYFDVAVATTEGFTVKHALMRVNIDSGVPELDNEITHKLPTWIGHSAPISAMMMLSNGSRLVTGDASGHLRVYAADDGAVGALKIRIADPELKKELFSSSSTAASVQMKKRRRAEVEPPLQVAPLRDFKPFKGAVTGLAAPKCPSTSPIGYHFFAASVDQTMIIVDSVEVKEVPNAKLKAPRPFMCLDYSDRTQSLVSGHDDGRAILWGLRQRVEGEDLQDEELPSRPLLQFNKKKQWGQFRRVICSVRWSPSNNHLFVATLGDGSVKVFDTRSAGAPLHTLQVTPFEHCISILTSVFTQVPEDDEIGNEEDDSTLPPGAISVYTGGTDGVLRKHIVHAQK